MKTLILSLIVAVAFTSSAYAQQKLWGFDANGVYSLNKDGSDFTYFCQTNDNHFSLSSMVHSYGKLQAVRTGEYAELIEIDEDGDAYQTLFKFPAIPEGNLTTNNDGYLYGFADHAIFRIRSDGSGFTKIKDVNGDLIGGLISSNGTIYGITSDQILFGYTPDTNLFFTQYYLTDFSYESHFCMDLDGNFYGIGVTKSDAQKVIFKIPYWQGSYSYYLHNFSNVPYIRYLTLSVTEAGNLAGVVQNWPESTNDFFQITPSGVYSVLTNRNTEPEKSIPDENIIIHRNYFTDRDGNNPRGIFNDIIPSNTGRSFTLSGDQYSTFKIDQVLPDTATILAVNDSNIGSVSTGSLALSSNNELFGATRHNYAFAGGTLFKVNASGAKVLSLIEEGGKSIAADGVSVYGNYVFGNVSSGVGNIVRVNQDGSDFRKIYQFRGTDGRNPYGKLISGGDGYLYGMTYSGGTNTFGVIYRLKPDGTGFQKLYDFTNVSGKNPRGHLLDIGDGYLYGLTAAGGNSNFGTIFKILKDGTGFTKLFDFSGANGRKPYGGLCLSSNGSLYGVTSAGGSFKKGVIFKINRGGDGFSVVYNLYSTPNPMGDLIEDHDGMLYGIASNSIFKIRNDGSDFAVIANQNYGSEASLVLVDVAALTPDIFVKQPADNATNVGVSTQIILHTGKIGPSYTVQFSTTPDFTTISGTVTSSTPIVNTPLLNYDTRYFVRAKSDIYPVYGMVTSFTTKSHTERIWGSLGNAGAIYHVNTDGTHFTNYITRADNIPGFTAIPQNLTQLNDGSIVGTNDGGGPVDAGAYFRITNTGFSVIHYWEEYNFGNNAQGAEGNDGYIYGVGSTGYHYARVFKMKTDGSDYQFSRFYKYGFEIAGGVTKGNNDEMYGLSVGAGPGWIYRIRKDMTGVDQVFTFTSGPTGKKPHGEITVGPDGWLYMPLTGGGSSNKGTIFKISDDMQHYQKIHDFKGNDGSSPLGELKFDSHGRLYGVTAAGGNANTGVLFAMNNDGSAFTVLHNFNTGPEGHLVISHDSTIFLVAGNSLYRINTSGQNFQKVMDYPSSTFGKLILLDDRFDPPAIIPSARVATSGNQPDQPAADESHHLADIYPNPSASAFNLRVNNENEEIVELIVTDISGRMVVHQRGTTENVMQFGDELKSGCYLVKVSVGDKRIITRLIKQ